MITYCVLEAAFFGPKLFVFNHTSDSTPERTLLKAIVVVLVGEAVPLLVASAWGEWLFDAARNWTRQQFQGGHPKGS